MCVLFQLILKSPDLYPLDVPNPIWSKDVVLALVQSYNSTQFALVWKMSIQSVICKYSFWLLC